MKYLLIGLFLFTGCTYEEPRHEVGTCYTRKYSNVGVFVGSDWSLLFDLTGRDKYVLFGIDDNIRRYDWHIRMECPKLSISKYEVNKLKYHKVYNEVLSLIKDK